jgi:hypothetical protein
LVSTRFMTRRAPMLGNIRAAVSLSCFLLRVRIRLSQRTRIRRFDHPAGPHGPTAHRPVRGSSVHLCSCYVPKR